jgi:predicted ferric reductase
VKNIKLAFIALVAGLTGLWFLADTFVSMPFSFFSSRFAMVQYTGVMAVGAMSAAVLLALRPKWLEPRSPNGPTSRARATRDSG